MTADPTPTPEQPRTEYDRAYAACEHGEGCICIEPDHAYCCGTLRVAVLQFQARPEQDEAVRLADAVLEANRRWPNETRWASLHREAFVSGAEWAGAALATPPPAYCPGGPGHDPNTGPGSDYCPNCGQYAPPSASRNDEAELSALDDWKWYGDWPERSHGAGDGWMHVHPDGTRWVHPEKSCQLVSEQH